MAPDDPGDGGQADPGSLVVVCRVETLEGQKQPICHRHIEPGSVVANEECVLRSGAGASHRQILDRTDELLGSVEVGLLPGPDSHLVRDGWLSHDHLDAEDYSPSRADPPVGSIGPGSPPGGAYFSTVTTRTFNAGGLPSGGELLARGCVR